MLRRNSALAVYVDYDNYLLQANEGWTTLNGQMTILATSDAPSVKQTSDTTGTKLMTKPQRQSNEHSRIDIDKETKVRMRHRFESKCACLESELRPEVLTWY